MKNTQTFLSSAVKNQKIEEFSETDPSARNTNHPLFKSIIQYRKHRSSLDIKNNNGRLRFNFYRFSVDFFFLISFKKTAQASEGPAKIFKQNADICVDYISIFFKKCIDQGNFPFFPKHTSIMLVFNEGYRGRQFEKLLCIHI